MKLIQKFEKTFFLHDLRRSGRKSLLCKRIPAVKEAIDATSNENQSSSIRKVSRSTGVQSASVHRIMRKCIISLQTANVTRTEGERLYLQVEFLCMVIFWSDETYLHFD